MPLMDHVKRLTLDIGKRPSASVAEARAARYIEDSLRSMGISCDSEKFKSRRNDVFSRAVCQLSLFLVVLAYRSAPLFFYSSYLVLMVATMLEHLGRSPLGALQWRYHSGNVVAVLKPYRETEQKVVIMAALDTPRTQALRDSPGMRVSRLTSCVVFSLSLLLGMWLTLITGAYVLKVSSEVTDLLWKIALSASFVNLLAAALSLITILRSRKVNENESSPLAALIAIAERFSRRRLSKTELWLVAVGSNATGGIGVKRFLQKHRKDLRGASFIFLHPLGRDRPVAYRKIGMVMPFHASRDLIRIAEKVNESYPHYRLLVRGDLPVLDGAYRLASKGKRLLVMSSQYDRSRSKEERRRERVVPIALRENIGFLLNVIDFMDSRGTGKKRARG